MKLFAVLSIFAIGCAVQATPVSLATGGDKAILTTTAFSTSKDVALNAAITGSGIHSLVDPNAPHAAGFSPAPVSSLERRQTLPLMVFCSGVSCSGACVAFTLIGDPLNTCFLPSPDPFASLFISNPSALELLFQVAVGGPGCTGLVIVPQTNVCFNINPLGQSWALLNTGVTF